MGHVQVLEAYINFALMYTADHILSLLPIKYLINEEGEPTTPLKLVIGMKPSIYHLRVLLCTYVRVCTEISAFRALETFRW